MRIGQNPAKFIDHVPQPARVTVAVISYIPFLGGYYAEGLEILKTCLGSLQASRQAPGATPFDLLVFDNASCPEVREFLVEQQRQGVIQFLILSDRNIGKGGAWNVIFGAAPGEFVAYADSDVYFYPGWLEALLPLFERFPKLGMVTGQPLRVPEEYSTSTVEWAQQAAGVQLERGRLLPWEDFWRHVRSLGVGAANPAESEAEARQRYEKREDLCLTWHAEASHPVERYYVGAGHFQFVARREVLQSLLPLPSDRPMGQMRELDIAMNRHGYLRLCTAQWWVQHLGNSLAGFQPGSVEGAVQTTALEKPSKLKTRQGGGTKKRGAEGNRFWRRLLFWIHNKSFDLLYRRSR